MFKYASFILVLLCAVPSAGKAEAMSRQQKEAFLKHAKVLSVQDVGEGVTHPLKVELRDGDVKMNAIFKSIDLKMKSPMRFGAETVSGYIDSYKYEIAAYELDKLLGLDILPVVVERKIDGKKGAIREWIGDVMPRYGHAVPPPDPALLCDWTQTVWLFDYLVYNVDRRTNNVIIGRNWRPVLIDHSMAFTTFEKPFRPLWRFPKEIVAQLRTLDDRAFEKALGRYLSAAQIKALMRRRDRILKMVDDQLATSDASDVFFSISEIRSPE